MIINRHIKIVFSIALALVGRQFFGMDEEMAPSMVPATITAAVSEAIARAIAHEGTPEWKLIHVCDEDPVILKALINSHKEIVHTQTCRIILFNAIGKSKLDIVTWLVDNGMDVNKQGPLFGIRPLEWAAFHKDLEMVRLLVRKGANIYAQNNDRETALDVAKKEHHNDIVTYLSSLMVPRQTLYALLTCKDFISSEEPLEQFPPEHINFKLKPLIAEALAGQ